MNSFPSTGQIARASLVVFGLWALTRWFWLARDFLFVVFLAILLGTFLSIFVDRLQKWHIPRVVGGPLVFLLFLAVIGGLGWAAAPTLREQASELASMVPRLLDRAATWLSERYSEVIQWLPDEGSETQIDLQSQLASASAKAAENIPPVISTIGSGFAYILVILFTGLYLTVEQDLFIRNSIRLVPPHYRVPVAEAMSKAGKALRGWLLGTVINAVVVGLLTGLSLWALGIPTALALAIIAGLLEVVPVFGPILAAIPAIAVALMVSPSMGLWVLLLYVGIQQIESNLLHPIVMKGTVKIPPALSLTFQVMMAVVFGFLGIVVAVPLLAIIIVVVSELYIKPMEARDSPPT